MQNIQIRIQNSEFRILRASPLLNPEPHWYSSRNTGLNPRRAAFTLTELLIVITIIGIMTGLGLSALAGATELAREQRTRSIIAKLDQLIMERYESYRTRAVPIRIGAGTNPRVASLTRLTALRELMRLEMPDRISDLCNTTEITDVGTGNSLNAINAFNNANASRLTSLPSLARSYKRQAARAIAISGGWTTANQSSECLYLIVSSMHDGDKNAIDFFSSDEIGDIDEDGMKEILDAWGTPIQFLRWPAGFAEQPGADGAWGLVSVDDDNNGVTDDITEAGWAGTDDVVPQTTQTRNYLKAPDPFDPIKADPRWSTASLVTYPYALRPLIFSAGRDKSFDIDVGSVVYSQTTDTTSTPLVPPSDPYYSPTPGALPEIGRPGDSDGDGSLGYTDNITNHYQQTP